MSIKPSNISRSIPMMRCSQCGRVLDNPQDPTSKRTGTKCLSCSEDDVIRHDGGRTLKEMKKAVNE
jgi:hypothetical protein